MKTGKIMALILALGMIVATVTACGRRAPLDTPSQAAKAAGDKASADNAKNSDKKKSDTPFFLDPMIE